MNTFNSTIQHNLNIGLTNAINQIWHLENLIAIAERKEPGLLSIAESSLSVIETLKKLQDSLSLIEPEGEQPNEAMYKALKNLTFTANKLWDDAKPIKDGPAMKVTHPIIIQAEHVLEKYAPVTLSEASNHSFQQGVEIPEKLVKCPDCFGDGKETCHNPDHGFLRGISGVVGANESACPGCGHSEDHKPVTYKDGKYYHKSCEMCEGSGRVTMERYNAYVDEFVDEKHREELAEICLGE